MADAIPSLCIEFERLPGVQLSCSTSPPMVDAGASGSKAR